TGREGTLPRPGGHRGPGTRGRDAGIAGSSGRGSRRRQTAGDAGRPDEAFAGRTPAPAGGRGGEGTSPERRPPGDHGLHDRWLCPLSALEERRGQTAGQTVVSGTDRSREEVGG